MSVQVMRQSLAEQQYLGEMWSLSHINFNKYIACKGKLHIIPRIVPQEVWDSYCTYTKTSVVYE